MKNKSVLLSRTDCQAAQSNAKTKAWQRVCLSNRTTKPTDKPADEKEHRSDNITYTQAGVSCFVGQESSKFKVQFFVGSSVVKIPACVYLKTVSGNAMTTHPTDISTMTEKEFPVTLKLRIDWSELDYFGHVNNVSFFKYIQSSRVNYWDNIGLTKSHRDTNIGPMLVSCKCDFKRPLFYPGQVTILARVDFIKNTSFSICHRLIDDKGEIAAEAQDIMVMFDFNRNEKITFPKDLKDKIEKLENKLF